MDALKIRLKSYFLNNGFIDWEIENNKNKW